MRYLSTRGRAPVLSFEDVLLTGLASDGGLYVPESLPSFTPAELDSMAAMSYSELALKIVHPFVADCFAVEELAEILEQTYAEFRHPAVAPLLQLNEQQWLLELFQGPTLAFKDFALQLLGRLLDAVLQRRGERIVVLGATSGDTGSAAIAGCQACDNIDIYILHPHQRVSEVQRRQMTTLSSSNVHNMAVEGDFDDCQAMVKASFRDQSFLPDGRRLVAVNSINWARIMAQIVYYFYAGLALGAPHRAASYSVPTGNFGDIYAGYLAKQMGLPISRLMIATNRNDVLHRILSAGAYQRRGLEKTLSPSMDITVSSNFERLLLDAYQRDQSAVAAFMASLDTGEAALSDEALAFVRAHFDSHTVTDEQTLAIIRRVWTETAYLLDPHSAIGVAAAEQGSAQQKWSSKEAHTYDPLAANAPWVTLATAHPAKFPEAITASGVATAAELPTHMADLFDREEQYSVLPAQLDTIQTHISSTLGT
ncbi:MAG: threonine synthase [Pseudomonadota bacterium]